MWDNDEIRGVSNCSECRGEERDQMSRELAVSDGVNYTGDLNSLSVQIVQSGLFSAVNTPEKALTLMMLAKSQGLHVMKALQIYHLIQSRVKLPDGSFGSVVTPTLKADYVLARFLESGGTVEWTEFTDTSVTGVFATKERKITVQWTIEMANRAGYTQTYENKPGNWQKRPRVMLSKRCITEALRLIDPGIFMGMNCEDDIEPDEVVPTATARATPQSAPTPSKVPDNLKKVSGVTIDPPKQTAQNQQSQTPAQVRTDDEFNDLADEAASEINAVAEINGTASINDIPARQQESVPVNRTAPQQQTRRASVTLPDKNTLARQVAATQAASKTPTLRDDLSMVNREFTKTLGISAEDPRFASIWSKHTPKDKPNNAVAYFQDLKAELEAIGKEFSDEAQAVIARYEGGAA